MHLAKESFLKITALFAGKPIPFGPRKSPSSIVKNAFEMLNIEAEGAIEDEQGDKKLHGGVHMALHQFSQNGYTQLQAQFPDIADKLQVGTIGENLSAPDMTDDNIFIGDVYQIGEVSLQVSSPRAPCSRINQRYGKRKIDLFILEQGIIGWYFRVLKSGKINVGDSIVLTQRNDSPVSIKTLMHMTKPQNGMQFSKAVLQEAQQTPGLSPEWQDKLARQVRKAE